MKTILLTLVTLLALFSGPAIHASEQIEIHELEALKAQWAERQQQLGKIRVEKRSAWMRDSGISERTDTYIRFGNGQYHAIRYDHKPETLLERLVLQLAEDQYIELRDNGSQLRITPQNVMDFGHVFNASATRIEVLATPPEAGEWAFILHNPEGKTDYYRVEDATGIVLQRVARHANGRTSYRETRQLMDIDPVEVGAIVERIKEHTARVDQQQLADSAAATRVSQLTLAIGTALLFGLLALFSRKAASLFGAQTKKMTLLIAITVTLAIIGSFFAMNLLFDGFYSMILAIPASTVVMLTDLPGIPGLYLLLSLGIHALFFGALFFTLIALTGRLITRKRAQTDSPGYRKNKPPSP
jgi:hypothetical protein